MENTGFNWDALFSMFLLIVVVAVIIIGNVKSYDR
jgi:uncharacterized integral membrane protein